MDGWREIQKDLQMGKRLSDKHIPLRRRRRLGVAVAGITPTASQLTKIDKMQSSGCRLCRIARKAGGKSTDGLAVETYYHINSAGCEEMATTVTAAHHSTPSRGTCITAS